MIAFKTLYQRAAHFNSRSKQHMGHTHVYVHNRELYLRVISCCTFTGTSTRARLHTENNNVDTRLARLNRATIIYSPMYGIPTHKQRVHMHTRINHAITSTYSSLIITHS